MCKSNKEDVLKSNTRKLQLLEINKDEIIFNLEKLEFDHLMSVKSLERKITYYNSKYQNSIDSLEKDNIQDIIIKTQFEIKFNEKKLDRDIRLLKLDLETIEDEIDILESENNVSDVLCKFE